MKSRIQNTLKEYALITLAAVILVIGVYFFKFPNHFSFGGVTGISIVAAEIRGISASTFNFIINMVLLVFGFLFLGKGFGIKTVYVSILSSAGLSLLERFCPLDAPLTSQPVLELLFAIFLPALSSAILFNLEASGGGTDIIAMILKKYTSIPIGYALFFVDLFIVVSACFVFDIQTGLFSLTGLLAKSFVIDNMIENFNLCKTFMIVCTNPDPICDFICNQLDRSATVYHAEGAFTHQGKTIILSVMRRGQAVQLRNYIRSAEPDSFMVIFNSSEIIGKGFRGLN